MTIPPETETLTEKEIKAHFAGSEMKVTGKMVMVVIGGRVYKRDSSDGLYYRLGDGEELKRASDGP